MRKIENSVSSSNEVSKVKKGITAFIAAVALSACGGGNGGEKVNASPDKSPSATSTAAPTATQEVEPVAETPAQSETEAPESNVSLEGITSVPTREQIELAKEGIPGDLTAAEAIAYAGLIHTVHSNSGEFSFGDGNEFIESQASYVEGHEILEAMYGPHFATMDTTNPDSARLEVGGRVAGAVLLNEEPNTYTNWVPDESTQVENADGTVTIEFDDVKTSSIPTLSEVYDMNDNRGEAILEHSGDRWYFVTTSVIGAN